MGKIALTVGSVYEYDGKSYLISDEEPKTGDLVLTESYGVWKFMDMGNRGVPMPYWGNKNACKKLVLL